VKAAVSVPLLRTAHVRSSAIFHPRYIQNVRFLQDFWATPPAVAEADAARVIQFVETAPGIRLDDLLQALPMLTVDVIWTLLATQRLFTDFTATSLMQHDQVALYSSAAAVLPADTVPAQRMPPTNPILIHWDQRLWHAEPAGETIVLRPEVGAPFTLTRQAYQGMVDAGTLRPITAATPTPTPAAIREALVRAGPTAHATANQRLAQILAASRGEPTTASARSLQRWRAAFRQAEEAHGCGYLGLLGRVAERGNRTQRAAETSLALLDTCLREQYAAPHAPTAAAIYRRYQQACTDQGLHPVSERTFYRVRVRMMTPALVTARSGRRIAYPTQPFVWSLEQTTPRHGERPLAIAHLDHTELDILLVSSVTGKPFARPWLSLLTDAYSRRILALYLTYDPPSYRSAMMIFRVCVQRFGRLPQDLVVDGGTEFGGVAFETLLARYFVTKKERPAGHPRFGSLIERLFGTTTTEFINQLRGNTQATKQVRTMTPAVDPQAHAVWTLERLAARLSEWAYEIYDQRAHPALGMSPRAAFSQGMAHAGLRDHRMIPLVHDI
jgi:putative transposase